MAAVVGVLSTASAQPSHADGSATATYTATQTLPVPPASNFAGSGGGDGWAVALNATQVFNIFHHQSSTNVACHLQADATACWPVRTITDGDGHNFATSGHAGLWLDQSSNKLYSFVTRTSDLTAGVVCIDTVAAATNPNPFCGFTALGAPGDGDISSGSSVTNGALIGHEWFAFNVVPGSPVGGTKNKLLCFDTSTLGPCAGQPFTVNVGAGTVNSPTYPPPGISAIAGKVIFGSIDGSQQKLACFDQATHANCAGAWPIDITNYVSAAAAPFPLLTPTGAVSGVCLPNGIDPCFNLAGASVPTPAGMAAAIPSGIGWSGSSFVLGPRVYVPNGSSNQINCFNASTGASCANFPKAPSNLSLLYTVNADPYRPTCIWLNADNGSAQIQNFDAYTGGPCGAGAVRVLAASFVAPAVECQPATYTSLEVLEPARAAYDTGSISFQDIDANPIPGAADAAIDASGIVDLRSYNLTTALGLPQFLISLTGGSAGSGNVTVKLTWTGVDDPACLGEGITKTVNGGPTTTPPPGTAPAAVPVQRTPSYTG